MLLMQEDYPRTQTLSLHYDLGCMHICCFSNLMDVSPKHSHSVLPHQWDSHAIQTTVPVIAFRFKTGLFFLSGRSRRGGRAMLPTARFSVPSQIWVCISLSIEIGALDLNLVQERCLVTSFWEPKTYSVLRAQKAKSSGIFPIKRLWDWQIKPATLMLYDWVPLVYDTIHGRRWPGD